MVDRVTIPAMAPPQPQRPRPLRRQVRRVDRGRGLLDGRQWRGSGVGQGRRIQALHRHPGRCRRRLAHLDEETTDRR
jgi:hypothetical protein